MLKGSTPIRLSQIDMSPFVRAAKMNEAASLNLSNAVTKTISDFTKKQQKKRDDNANIEAIMDMLSLDKKTASAVYKDETVRDAFKIQQEAQGNFVRKQREQVELEILQGEQQRVQEQRIHKKRIEKTRLNNCGIDIIKPPILQSKLENAVENPRVSEPWAIKIIYSKINKNPRDETKGIACSVASPCFILKYL